MGKDLLIKNMKRIERLSRAMIYIILVMLIALLGLGAYICIQGLQPETWVELYPIVITNLSADFAKDLGLGGMLYEIAKGINGFFVVIFILYFINRKSKRIVNQEKIFEKKDTTRILQGGIFISALKFVEFAVANIFSNRVVYQFDEATKNLIYIGIQNDKIMFRFTGDILFWVVGVSFMYYVFKIGYANQEDLEEIV